MQRKSKDYASAYPDSQDIVTSCHKNGYEPWCFFADSSFESV